LISDKQGGKGVGWIHLVRDRVQWRAIMSTVMKLRVLWKVISWATISFLRS